MFKQKMSRRLERLQKLKPGTLALFKQSYEVVKTRDEQYLSGPSERRAKIEAGRMLAEQFGILRKRGWPV